MGTQSQTDEELDETWRRQNERDERARKMDAPEEPRPLRREIPPATPFPVDALSGQLGDMVRAVHEKVQAPLPICANSALAVATFAVQPHADVELPTGALRPTSEFFATIAESGERKSAADDEFTAEIREYEMELENERIDLLTDYQITRAAWTKQRDQLLGDKVKNASLADKKRALAGLGDEPEPPLVSQLLASEPTLEGVIRLMREGQPGIGLFSDEGGQFVGGHAMSDENRLKTAAGLSNLWDGHAVRRTRAGEGSYLLNGRRLTMHLLVQPGVANGIFNDPILADQGLLSRILAVMPESAAGTRFWKEPSEENFRRIRRFRRDLGRILREQPCLVHGKRNELQPRKLPLSSDARNTWVQFADHVEREMREGGDYESIHGLANKLPEHAARLAGVFTLFNDLSATEIHVNELDGAIVLVQFYAEEATRIRETSKINSDIKIAEKLLRWLHQNWEEPDSGNSLISLPDIYQNHRSIKDKATATKIVSILVEHGWLAPSDPTVINGKKRHGVWRIVREGGVQ